MKKDSIKTKRINVDRFRITILLKSLKNISAQIIDDRINKTIVSASSNEKEMKKIKKNKTDLSIAIGEILAKGQLKKKLTKFILIEEDTNITGELRL